MSEIKRIKERRVHKRFRVHNGIFAVLGPYSSSFGQVFDISKGGISFFHKAVKELAYESSELSLIFEDNAINLNSAPFKFKIRVIRDFNMEKNGRQGLNIKMKCALQFSELTPYQYSWLDQIIDHHTIEKIFECEEF